MWDFMGIWVYWSTVWNGKYLDNCRLEKWVDQRRLSISLLFSLAQVATDIKMWIADKRRLCILNCVCIYNHEVLVKVVLSEFLKTPGKHLWSIKTPKSVCFIHLSVHPSTVYRDCVLVYMGSRHYSALSYGATIYFSVVTLNYHCLDVKFVYCVSVYAANSHSQGVMNICCNVILMQTTGWFFGVLTLSRWELTFSVLHHYIHV